MQYGKTLTAVGLVLGLAACANNGTTAPTLPTPTQIATTAQQIQQVAGVGITVAQAGACEAQSLLNLIGSMEGGGAAQQAATASAAAGKLCVWTNPVAQ